MRNAPSVSYPVGRCSLAGWLIGGTALAGAAVVATAAMGGQAGWRTALAAAVLAACTATSAAAWWRSRTGRLAFGADGTWRWQDARAPDAVGEPGRIVRSLDAQRWVLLRWRPAPGGRDRWLWVEARRDPAHWRALRRAVYSPAGVDAAHLRAPDQPPAAES